MKKILLYDREKYTLLVLDRSCGKPYTHIADGDIIELRDRKIGTIYRDVYNGKNRTNLLVFLELAGGIYVEPAFYRYMPCQEIELFNDIFDGNIVRVIYDGITHITIEDRDYIYCYNIPYYVDIDIKYQDKIFLIIVDYCEKRRVIIVNKPHDYVEMLNIEGDKVEITDKCIYITTQFTDSMGRIRREEYTIQDNEYRRTNVDFEYTYNEHYNVRTAKFYIEDALYSRDYHFVTKHMSSSISDESIEEYFDSILPQHIDILREENCDDVMRFLMREKGRTSLIAIRLYLDTEGRIANFEEVEDEG